MRYGYTSGMMKGCVLAALCLAAAGFSADAPVAPVVAGYYRLKDEGKAPPAELGQVLLGELNCTACHAAPDARRILAKGAPDLHDAGARITPQYLRHFIANPHGVKPGTTMPDLLHGVEAQGKQDVVENLTEYLISLDGPIKPATQEGDAVQAELGKQLYHTVGCIACHAAENGSPAAKVPSIPLPNLAEKTTVNELETFLLDPVKVRPGSRMPSSGLGQDEAHALAVYLLRNQLDNPQAALAAPAKVQGIQVEYFEEHVSSASLDAFSKLKHKSKHKLNEFTLNVAGRRDENFALKFFAVLDVPRDGKYTFYTTSDDGSFLYLDGKPVVDNDGAHGPATKSGTVDLHAGDHPIVVTFFQEGGGMELKVEWEGPNIKRQQIPTSSLYAAAGRPMIPLSSEKFSGNTQKAEAGGKAFAELGCISCHTLPNKKSERQYKALNDLNSESKSGCLGAHPASQAPLYDLNDEQRTALKAAIADKAGLSKAFEPSEQVVHTMAALNCFACHKRGNIGGPGDRSDNFKMTAEYDMGEEGKIPPLLNHVGEKIEADALEQIVFEGKLRVRPMMATRMPVFSKQAAGTLVDAFQKADTAEGVAPVAPPLNQLTAKDGRLLVGVKGGLGCVNCHGMNGAKSLGMPAPDLGSVAGRIKYGWMRKWLDNPAALVPGTRMPQFFPEHETVLKNVAGGTEESQTNAIWTYLSQGKEMALPSGLMPAGGYELVPTDTPIVLRSFVSGVGSRTTLAGFPEMVHVAFDGNGVRLAKAWRGRFYDTKSVWQGRGGNASPPLGIDIINMPPGPSFAVLENPDASWPKIQEATNDEKFRNIGGHSKGYELDKEERPVFRYILNGIEIREQPMPDVKANKTNLIRKFDLSSKEPARNLYFMAAAGTKIEEKSPGVWSVEDGKTSMTVAISPAGKFKLSVRDSDGHKQLLFPVIFENGTASFEVEVTW